MGGICRRSLVVACLLAAAAIAVPVFSATAGEQVVGGTRAAIADHPYAVYLTNSSGSQFCGGALVARDKVLTAAHCAKAYRPRDLRVVAGREDKEESTAGEMVRISDVWVHPKYTDAITGDDVALLTLAKPVPYRPISLATATHTAGTSSTVLGWGRTAENGPLSRYLMKATVPLVSDEACREAYRAYDKKSMVCAGLADGGVDACQGDSGGPLVVAGRLAGIASWGEGCALPGRPGVYTRVAEYAAELAPLITPPSTPPPP